MALQSLALDTNAVLSAVQISASLSDADIASINALIADDQAVISANLGPSASAIQGAVIFTGNSTTPQIASVSVTTPSGQSMSAIPVGSALFGPGLSPGTRVTAIGALGTVSITPAPTAASTGGTFIATTTRPESVLQRNGILTLPNRGQLKLLPGDVVGVGPTGEVFVLPKTVTTVANSKWNLT